jgi:hypothetical protein
MGDMHHMSRTMIGLMSVLAIVVIGGGFWFAMNQDRVKDLLSPNKNTTTNSAVITNQPRNQNASYVTNVSAPVEVKGDTATSGTITVAGVALKISSVLRSPFYIDVTAAEGKTLMVVFIDPILSTQVAPVIDTIGSDIHLDFGTSSVSPRRTKIASDQIKNDRGYIIFEIPDSAKKLTLVSGSGPTAARLALP